MWGKSETRGREGGPRLSTRKRSVEESVDTSVANGPLRKGPCLQPHRPRSRPVDADTCSSPRTRASSSKSLRVGTILKDRMFGKEPPPLERTDKGHRV